MGRSSNSYNSIRGGSGGRYHALWLGYKILTIHSHVRKMRHHDTAKSKSSKAGQLTSPGVGTKYIPSQLVRIRSKQPRRLSKTNQLT